MVGTFKRQIYTRELSLGEVTLKVILWPVLSWSLFSSQAAMRGRGLFCHALPSWCAMLAQTPKQGTNQAWTETPPEPRRRLFPMKLIILGVRSLGRKLTETGFKVKCSLCYRLTLWPNLNFHFFRCGSDKRVHVVGLSAKSCKVTGFIWIPLSFDHTFVSSIWLIHMNMGSFVLCMCVYFEGRSPSSLRMKSLVFLASPN